MSRRLSVAECPAREFHWKSGWLFHYQVHDSEEHEGGPKSFSVRWDNNTYSDGHTDDDVERIIYSHELQDRTFQQRWCTVVQVSISN